MPESHDEVDRIVHAWRRERPDLDFTPLQVLSRVSRLAKHLDRTRRIAFARSELEYWEFDVLSALRRAGEPYRLSPKALLQQTLRERLQASVVLADERFRAACIANFASGWSSMGVRSALVPILVVELLHKEELWTGIAFAIAAVAQTLALGPAGTFVEDNDSFSSS